MHSFFFKDKAPLFLRHNVHVRAHYENFNASAVELPVSVVQELASFSEVSYISLHRDVDSLGHVETTTGALATRTQQSNLDGRGVTIAVLAQNLNMSVVAEGVETQEQVTQLRGLGCEYAQGFFFFKPMNALAIAEVLADVRRYPLSSTPSEVLIRQPNRVSVFPIPERGRKSENAA